MRANADGKPCVLNHGGKGVRGTGVGDLFQAVLWQQQRMWLELRTVLAVEFHHMPSMPWLLY